MDWKTSIHEEFVERYQMQMQLYAYALRSQGKRVVGASIIDIKQTYESGTLVKHEVDISEPTISGLMTRVRR